MAYDSNGQGVFTVRPGLSRADVIKALEENGGIDFQFSLMTCCLCQTQIDGECFWAGREIKLPTFKSVRMSFSGAVHHLEKELEVVRKNFNGEFDISGKDAGDLWKLVFKDGKIFQRKGKILYDEPEELERLDKLWK